MSRFTSIQPVTGTAGVKSLTLMTAAACDQALLDSCAWALEDAVKILKKADTLLSTRKPSAEVVRYADRYFLTGKKISDVDLLNIRSVVTMILNGLKSDVTLKVGTLSGDPGEVVHGSVSFHDKDKVKKPHHNVVYDVTDKKSYTTGAIKLNRNTMASGRLGVVTLIHEASHKYAGTADYCYFKDDSRTADGAFSDKEKALNNADSYAWFIVKIGRDSTFASIFKPTTFNNLHGYANP